MFFAFDFDGVIRDSLNHHIRLLNCAAREFGLPKLFSREKVKKCDIMTWESVAEQCGVTEILFESFWQNLFDLLLSEHPETQLFDGIPVVLRMARTLDRTVVITSNFESLIR